MVVAEVENEEYLRQAENLEREIRRSVVANMGAVRTVLLKPPKWIVKSTAGNTTRQKLLQEHPELASE